MAGHSKFKNIMHRKGAQDLKRGKLFARLAREILIAAKIGREESSNPRLRSAIATAKAANMPKSRIQAAIDKANNPKDNTRYQEIIYEGYGPHGVAIIVEALTDNKNRTASGVRSIFTKYGGNLGTTDSVSHMFDRIGSIVYEYDVAGEDTMLEVAAEVGALDCISQEEHEIICTMENFHKIRDILEEKFNTPEKSGIIWKPKSFVSINENNAGKIIKLIDGLEDDEDVQSVISNFIIESK